MAARRRNRTEVPRRTAFGSALRRLARRDHSEQELREALGREGHTDTDVDEAVERLRSARFLDDAAFALRFARSRLVSHGLGRGRIRQGLRSRGVAGDLVERAVGEATGDGGEQEVLDRLAKRYWRGHAALAPATRLHRLWVFLLRRGFPAALVHERLRALWPRQREVLGELEGAAPEDTE